MNKKGKLYGLDLFSGIGGNSLGLSDYIRTIAYCEQDQHAQAVLLSRMGDGSIPIAPIWDDVSTLTGEAIDIPIDIIIAGFPCQDISVAGKGAGLEGERSGLFFEVMRLAKEVQPTFIFLENVPAIRTRGLDTVVQELTALGYDCRWTMLAASDVGAPHKRERWFLLARRIVSDSASEHDKQVTRCMESVLPRTQNPTRLECVGANVSDPDSSRLEVQQANRQCADKEPTTSTCGWWQSEPDVGRVVNGLPQRVDRIKRLGNAVVPEQAKEAFEVLMGIK